MAFAALKRLGQSLLGNDTLRKVQQHLERDEGALAWREACSESWSSAEGLATSAVAAGCCGHWDEAAEILQRVESLPAVSVEEHLACQALLHRVCALREQQQTGQGLLCGPLWCPEPPALELPASWSSWARALPQVAEYVGPVEVRWTEGSERGLFTSRAVEAGEVLMVAQPIAFAAQNGPLLVAELRRKCAVSQRARRRLECLADGGARGSTMSPEEVTQELFIRADEPPGEPTVEASPEGDLRLQDILNHNVFVVDHSGEAALYGLPSMLNHSCDVTALKLVLVFFEKAMIFIATRDLEKGEELCHRYFDVEGSVRERRGESSKWGFSCDCCRCHFEANTLPFSDCGKAVEAAVTLFQEELRYDMRALSQAAEVKAEVEQKRWPLLQRLLSAVDAVEDAARASGWSEKELAWSLALVQKLSNAALWCLLTHRSTGAANGAIPYDAPKDPLAVRCKVLRRLELALRHSEAFGFDHLQNLHLLWSALEEVRVSVLARAAIQLKPQVLEPMVGPVPGRVPAPWSRVAGQEFLAQVQALGLRSFLQQEGGLVQVKDFLPMDLAQEMLEMLKDLAQDEWYLSENQSSVDAEHRFWRYEGQKLDKVKSIMQELDPKLHPRLQGAKYESGGKITLHNDALRWVVRPDECSDQYPAGTTVYRKVALIYYLTQDWRPEHGGLLVDAKEGAEKAKAVVPEFNSLIAFLVPREHWVSEMAPGAPARFSLFGWLHDLEPYGDELKPLGESSRAMLEQKDEVKAAQDAAEEAKRQCEHGFRIRFGMPPEVLKLGLASSPAKSLLRRLSG